MELQTGNIKKLYRKYLFAAFGSAIITSIYSTVDMIVSGQYEGPVGSAALSVIMPMWSVIISVGLLFGLGGSILMSNARGAGNREEGDRCFTMAMLVSGIVTVLMTAGFVFFRTEFLYLCGANDEVLPCALAYTKWLTVAVPLFLMGEVLAAFIRNDGAPRLAMAAVLFGGAFNIFGDIFFVFTCDMGIEGAGLATAIGQLLALLIMCGYFFTKRCALRLRALRGLGLLGRMLAAGFAPFLIDISFGVTIMLFNNQIMRYSGATELAVFGTVANIAILFQSLFYGVGQAIQPLVSVNAGADKPERVRETLRLALLTTGAMGILFCAGTMLLPGELLGWFMAATDEVLAVGPPILRVYSFAFLLMGVNIVASYYLQAMLKTAASLAISLLRGFVLCALFLFTLPAAFGFEAIWWTMPLTELLTLIASVVLLRGTRYRAPLG